MLSRAGKEDFIKLVVQAIPTYAMNCFLLPEGQCNEMEVMIRNFWQSSKLHWIGWDIMSKSKDSGGAGFQDIRAFNMALLANQAPRIVEFPNPLLPKH